MGRERRGGRKKDENIFKNRDFDRTQLRLCNEN